MTTRTLSFLIEPPTPQQRPIDRTDVSLRADPSFDWSFHADYTGEGLFNVVFENIAPGTMYYQLITYDDEGTASDPVEVEKTLGWDAPTGPINVTIVDSD